MRKGTATAPPHRSRENVVIVPTANRAAALASLDVLIGEWSVEARFPGVEGGPAVRSWFDWALDGQFLVQHTEVPIPEAPDSLAIVGVDPGNGGYTQHYFDSRGVVRLYAMGFANGVWTLTRESSDFSPLDFRQRFTGTFSEDGNTITGAWEKGLGDAGWEHDFDLIYHRVG
jgi:hypothetical protein